MIFRRALIFIVKILRAIFESLKRDQVVSHSNVTKTSHIAPWWPWRFSLRHTHGIAIVRLLILIMREVLHGAL
jgi:hypothetical protein